MGLPDFIAGNSLFGAIVSALGWSLVHFLWQGCVIAALFWLVCVLSRRENAHVRYWAGILSLLLSLAALAITFSVYYKPAAGFAVSPAHGESINTFLVLSGSLPDPGTLLQESIKPALPVLVFIWLLGVLVQSAQTVCGWIGIRRLVHGGDPDTGRDVNKMLEHLVEVLNIRRTVRILKSGMVRVPLAVGWLNPVILLPASVLLNLPREQLEMILAHELGHIKRDDFLINLLQIILETLLFYHPAIGWISRRVREERENCCDDLVVSRCRKPATYARALANLEMIRSPVPAAALTATGGNLIGRIKRIIDTELPRTGSGYVQVALLSAVALVVALGTHQGMLMSRALNEVAGSVSLAPSDVAWKTWGKSRATWAEGVMHYARSERLEARNPEAASVAGASDLMDQKPALTHPVAEQVPVSAKLPLISAPVNSKPEFVHQADLHFPVTREAEMDLSGASNPPAEARQSFKPAQPFEPVQYGLLGTATAVSLPTASILNKPNHVRAISTSEPRYPWWARAKKVEGFVQLEFTVDQEGRAIDITVADSIPSGAFDSVAQKALKKWKFQQPAPGERGSRLSQVFNFKLDNASMPRRLSRDCRTTGHRVCSQLPNGAIVVYINPALPKTAIAKIN